MTLDEVYQLGESSKQQAEEHSASFGDTVKAALRTSVTGMNTIFNTIARKHIMPVNKGDGGYYNKQEFKDIVKQEAPDISVDNMNSLFEAKNPEYLRAKIQNQKNYDNAIDTIEKAGGTGMAVEMVTSLADLPSWIVGGAVFKGAKAAGTALNISRAGSRMLYDMGTGAVAVGSAIGTSEALIQSEAGVNHEDRLEKTALYGAAFGIALPAVAHAIGSVSTGQARASMANNIGTVLDNLPGSGSLRGLASFSSADQLLNKTDNTIANWWGEGATTRVTAAKDANGNFVTANNDTAMNYKDTLVNSSLSEVGTSLNRNAKDNGISYDKINEEDGLIFQEFSNSVEQTVGRHVGTLDDATLIADYKAATGATELPHEVKQTKVDTKAQKMLDEADTIASRDLSNLANQKQQLLTARLQNVTDVKEINKITKEVDNEFSKYEKVVNKTRNKALKEIDKYKTKNAVTREDLPEDLYDVVKSYHRSKMFDDGTFVVPDRVKYMEDFYVRYAQEATKHGLRGIAGKDGRGYNHTMWNTDEILSDLAGAKTKIEAMLLDDELTKARIAKGELTLEDIKKKADNMVDMISKKDFTRMFIDETKGVTASSATRHKTMSVNKALHPELFVSNVDALVSNYAERLGGKLALKKTYGVDVNPADGMLSTTLKQEYEKVALEGKRLGHSPKQIERDVANVQAVAESILGVNRYNKDPNSAISTTVRLLKKGASALYSAGFVKYALIEPTVAIMRYGLKNTLKQYVPALDRLKEHVHNASPSDPLVRMMRQSGLAHNTLHGMKYDRFNNFDATASTSKFEMFLDKMSHVSRKYSGFNYVNDINDYVAGGAALAELQDVLARPNNLTKAESSRFARYGLSSQDIEAISRQNLIRDANGDVANWNYENWRDKDLAANLIRYLGAATRDTIMRADGTRVHRYQSNVNNLLGSMALQFTQMPTALYERLLINFGDEAATRTFVGMFTATAFMYTIMELEDIAKVKAGAKEARDSHEQLLLQAATRTPYAGIVPNFIDAGLMLTGHAPLGNAYTPRADLASMFLGAGYSTGNKVLKTLQGLGDGIDGTDASNFLKITPIINSYVGLSIGTKALEHDWKQKTNGASEESINYTEALHNIVNNH